jgi:SAM-dependent methyltransferase
VPGDYHLLATIYDTLGMAEFAAHITPRVIDFAQRHDWMGRRILEMGCGTSETLEWLTRHNYIVTGIDSAPAMVEISRQRLETAGLHHDVRQHDIRNPIPDVGTVDLVLALDVLNEFNSLRDLEAAFNNASTHLETGRMFIFDLHTIQGLTEEGTEGDRIAHNDTQLTVITSNSYDFERQISERHYLVFRYEQDRWQREAGTRTLRGYPVQAVASLLQRSGFKINHVVNTSFEDFTPGVSQARRILFVVEKQ